MSVLQTVQQAQSLNPLHPNWKETAARFKVDVEALPQVQSGAVNKEQAMSWLVAASKMLAPEQISAQILQAQGFGANEIQALWSFDNDKYYPTLSASEIYSLKSLESFKLPSQEDIASGRLYGVLRLLTMDHFGMNRESGVEKLMPMVNESSNMPWMLSKPGLVGSVNNDIAVVDIKYNYGQNLTQSDELRLHYHDLVLTDRKKPAKHLYQLNAVFDKTFLDSLKMDLEMDPSMAEVAFRRMQCHIKNNSDVVRLHLNKVTPVQSIHEGILSTGMKHWENVINGYTPDFQKEEVASLTQKQEQDYMKASRKATVTKQLKDAIGELHDKARSEFSNVATKIQLNDNHHLPYQGTKIRKRDELDLDGAALFLQTQGVDPKQLRNLVVENSAGLIAAAKAAGVDIEQFVGAGSPVKERVLTVAQEMGVDLRSFYTRSMDAYASGQSRGPIFEAIQEIKASTNTPLETLIQELTSSTMANAPALVTPSNKQVSAKPSKTETTMGI